MLITSLLFLRSTLSALLARSKFQTDFKTHLAKVPSFTTQTHTYKHENTNNKQSCQTKQLRCRNFRKQTNLKKKIRRTNT